MCRSRLFNFVVIAWVASTIHARAAGDEEGLALFEKRIRPVLIEHCYKCHSAESKELEAGLRVDTRAGIRRGGESGAAVMPGNVKSSLIVSALEHDDLEMPPEKKLPDTVIADFRRWIELGAPDPRDGAATVAGGAEIDIEKGRKFWSFQQPRRHAPPSIKHTRWVRSDIDRFILAKVEAAGLRPVADADRQALIRRASFALVGLPPTPDEIDAFVADKSPDAFEKVVDRLLASPHFGERWARHWLDIARYAESSGGGRTLVFPNAWRYRDYVIRSFNADKPFDVFLKEQIAGDLMPHRSIDEKRERITATGFLALGPTNFELQDKALLRMEVIDEQLDTIGRSMLGMTIGCARCHDHKFDPIPAHDYYALAGVFGSIKSFNPGNVASPVRIAVASPEEEVAVAAHEKKVGNLNKKIGELEQRVSQLTSIAGVGQPSKGKPTSRPAPAAIDVAKLPGVVVDNTKAELVGTWKRSTHNRGFVGSEYLHDEAAGKGTKSITFATKLPRDGVYDVRVSYTTGSNRAQEVPVTVRHAEGETSSRVDQTVAPPIDGVFASIGTFRFTSTAVATVRIETANTKNHVIADAVHFAPHSDADSRGEKQAAKTASTDSERERPSPADLATLQKELADVEKQLTALRSQRDKLKKNAPKTSNQVLSVAEDKPRDGHLHIRGGVRNLGPVVPRGVLQAATYGDAPKIPQSQSGRLQVAEWIASSQNPLTARVIANRVWHHLLGEGLVRTPDNFGKMGERPSHPELLDHLALRFINDDWSVKRLVREIMLSRTYQLASHPSKKALERDPENRLLSHAHRQRLDAESIRDAMLSVSGQLDLTAFGPTIRKGTKSELRYVFQSLRRSIYVPSFRNTQLDLLSVFDAANPNVVTGRRVASTLPTQALLLMNSPGVVEQSRSAAERLLADSSKADDKQRVMLLYRRAIGRLPRVGEVDHLVAYVARQQKNKVPQVDTWARVCQTIFACVDFRYVY